MAFGGSKTCAHAIVIVIKGMRIGKVNRRFFTAGFCSENFGSRSRRSRRQSAETVETKVFLRIQESREKPSQATQTASESYGRPPNWIAIILDREFPIWPHRLNEFLQHTAGSSDDNNEHCSLEHLSGPLLLRWHRNEG